jgi:hypothetical protein
VLLARIASSPVLRRVGLAVSLGHPEHEGAPETTGQGAMALIYPELGKDHSRKKGAKSLGDAPFSPCLPFGRP